MAKRHRFAMQKRQPLGSRPHSGRNNAKKEPPDWGTLFCVGAVDGT